MKKIKHCAGCLFKINYLSQNTCVSAIISVALIFGGIGFDSVFAAGNTNLMVCGDFENGFDDKLDYPTLEEAVAAAQGYVAGTMEADGFAYDGAAVYDADTNVCLRVYGDYPDEKAQTQMSKITGGMGGGLPF